MESLPLENVVTDFEHDLNVVGESMTVNGLTVYEYLRILSWIKIKILEARDYVEVKNQGIGRVLFRKLTKRGEQS